MGAKGSAKGTSAGFEGAIAGLGLADVIQLNGHNRFSGCIAVHYQGSSGLLFFRDGDLIHAEQGARVGEDAFYAVMQWPGGRFSLQPNVATTSHTIRRSTMQVLLDAHRLIDERRAGREPVALPTGAERPAGERDGSGVATAIRNLPGVVYALRLGADGSRLEDDSYPAEALEGQTAYLAMLGRALGEIFGAGELQSAVVHGGAQHLLVMRAGDETVSVLLERSARPEAVANEIRKALAPR